MGADPSRWLHSLRSTTRRELLSKIGPTWRDGYCNSLDTFRMVPTTNWPLPSAWVQAWAKCGTLKRLASDPHTSSRRSPALQSAGLCAEPGPSQLPHPRNPRPRNAARSAGQGFRVHSRNPSLVSGPASFCARADAHKRPWPADRAGPWALGQVVWSHQTPACRSARPGMRAQATFFPRGWSWALGYRPKSPLAPVQSAPGVLRFKPVTVQPCAMLCIT